MAKKKSTRRQKSRRS